MPKPNRTNPSPLRRLLPPTIIVLAALGIYFFVDFTVVSDWFRGLGFDPSPEMQQIISDLDLTSDGSRIFSATHATLKDNPDFSSQCGSGHEGTSILGCYVNGNIYVKNITDPDLAGIKQSTSAHELLHAVWARLDDDTRADLGKELDAFYSENQDILAERLENYEKSRWHDELHSIAGTEFSTISPKLSAHYAQFFDDLSKIVAFFDGYNSKFQTLRARSEALHEEIATLSAKIDEDTEYYESGVDDLNEDIADFRHRAENGYFGDDISVFYREQIVLNTRIEQLSARYNQINAKVDQINRLIEEYNTNAASLNSLNSALSAPATSVPSF